MSATPDSSAWSAAAPPSAGSEGPPPITPREAFRDPVSYALENRAPQQYDQETQQLMPGPRANMTSKELTRQLWEKGGREALNSEIEKDMKKAKMLDWLKENVELSANIDASSKSSGGGGSYRSGGGTPSTMSLGGGGGNPYLEALVSMLSQSVASGSPRHSVRER